MSIAESLVTIAKNEQKVYDAGYEQGKQIARQIIDRTIVILDDDQIKTVKNNALSYCTRLRTVCLPSLESIGANSFYFCAVLAFADLGTVSTIDSEAFASCRLLRTIILRKTDAVCTIYSENVFSDSPFISATGGSKVYVPEALIEAYRADPNWSALYCQFLPIEGSTYE